MMSGPPRSGSWYWLTSVPQTPATSTFSSAASGGMSGSSNSRSSVVAGPLSARPALVPTPGYLRQVESGSCSRGRQAVRRARGSLDSASMCCPLRTVEPPTGLSSCTPASVSSSPAAPGRAQTRIRLLDVLLEDLLPVAVGRATRWRRGTACCRRTSGRSAGSMALTPPSISEAKMTLSTPTTLTSMLHRVLAVDGGVEVEPLDELVERLPLVHDAQRPVPRRLVGHVAAAVRR